MTSYELTCLNCSKVTLFLVIGTEVEPDCPTCGTRFYSIIPPDYWTNKFRDERSI